MAKEAGPLRVNVPRPDEPSPGQVGAGGRRCCARAGQPDRAGRPRRRAGRGGPRPAPLRRDAGHPGGHHVPRQGCVPRRPPAGAGRGGVHAARLRQLRLRPRRPDHRPSATSCRSSTRARINPRGDTPIIHLHRFPAEVDAHYDVAVGLHSDIGRKPGRPGRGHYPIHPRPPREGNRIRSLLAAELAPRPGATSGSRSRRPGSWPTPGQRCAARTSCWSTPAR